jgi:hypothetical protein
VAAIVGITIPAAALTEARIVDVTCGGLTVVQTGLPPRALFDVEAIDGADGRLLVERETRSSADGRLRLRLHTDLHGIRRLHAEVERQHVQNSEYGEADVDLNRHCSVVGTKPVPVRSPGPSTAAGRATPTTPIAGPRSDDGNDPPWAAMAAAAAGIAFVVGPVVWWVRRRAVTGS